MKLAKITTHALFAFALVAGLALSMPQQAEAQGISPSPVAVRVNLTDGNVKVGSITLTPNAQGPETLSLEMKGLTPNTRFTLFLTHSDTLGALPAQFLSEFSSNNDGEAKLRLITEILDGFASANQSLENASGIADIQGAGLLPAAGGTANTIALNWFRVYEGVGTISVFGTSESQAGGGLVATSTTALP